MAITEYQDVRRIVQALSRAEQLQLVAELSQILQPGSPAEPRTSILELQGLGKQIWRELDAQEYVDRERASWTG